MNNRQIYPKLISDKSTPPRMAFTLIELLTILAIIGILAAILIPVAGNIRTKALEAKSTSNLRQIHTGFSGYAMANNNTWPAPRSRWSNAILPYVQLQVEMSGNQATDEALLRSIFVSPGWDQDEIRSRYPGLENEPWRKGYGMNVLLPDNLNSMAARYGDGANQTKHPLRIEQPSRTLLVIDSMNALAVPHFGGTENWELAATRYGGQLTALFADGHVRLMNFDENSDRYFVDSSTDDRRTFWTGRSTPP